MRPSSKRGGLLRRSLCGFFLARGRRRRTLGQKLARGCPNNIESSRKAFPAAVLLSVERREKVIPSLLWSLCLGDYTTQPLTLSRLNLQEVPNCFAEIVPVAPVM